VNPSPDAPAHIVRLLLGDQLNPGHSWFRSVDGGVVYVLLELRQETDYVRHHVQKVLAIFAAMSRFADELRAAGHRVVHRTLDDPLPGADLPAMLRGLAASLGASTIQFQEPDEYRLHAQLSDAFGPGVDSEHFLYPRDGVARVFTRKAQRLMETFYRRARVEHRVLLDDAGGPLGGQWNFDADNRGRMPSGHPVPPALEFAHDVRPIADRLARHGVETIGRADAMALPWPLDRREQLQLLAYFCQSLLPHFGQFQDHLGPEDWAYYHSRLSFGLNTKMLHPLEVIRAAEQAHRDDPDRVSLAQAEGFIRQILGWREFIRGIYWERMPEYRTLNVLDHQGPLPQWYWTGETRMACLRHAIGQSLDRAYAHHIQRLMLTGNFALLAGVHPDAVDAWYLGIYIDAFEWVELPNTRGMSQYADGGIVGTKPYVSSGQYIRKQGHYCGECAYRVEEKTGANACPFNALYWHFHHRHRARLERNPRIGMVYRSWDRMADEQRRALLAHGDWLLEHVDTL
jgi:deoxyribodipyrimidine photolyase-related protein